MLPCVSWLVEEMRTGTYFFSSCKKKATAATTTTNLLSRLFSGVSFPVAGVVLVLILFDGLKEGVLLPLIQSAYPPSPTTADECVDGTDVRGILHFDDGGEVVAVVGPFHFRVGYMLTRVVLVMILTGIALAAMAWVDRYGSAVPSITLQADVDIGTSEVVATPSEGVAAIATEASLPPMPLSASLTHALV